MMIHYIVQACSCLPFSYFRLWCGGRRDRRRRVEYVVPPDVDECYRSFSDKPISPTAAQVRCLQTLLWNFSPPSNVSRTATSRIDRVINNILRASGVRSLEEARRLGLPLYPPSGYRRRSEYRQLSRRELDRFHDVMNQLYRDGTIALFARIHEIAFGPQHNGASFLPWHRILLVVFEELMREIDPGVSLPYWDSSIDQELGDEARLSRLWSSDYLGNGAGAVRTGPFAGWVTNQGALERDFGRRGRLFRKQDLREVLSRCRLEEIAQPTAEPLYDFEWYHGGPHVWIGGDMSAGNTAAWDPAFYLHHAYVDYVWEVFRRRQRSGRCRVDPQRDYPQSANGSHAIDATMIGLAPFINGDGLQDYWINFFYGYNPTPTCPDCCLGCARPPAVVCDQFRGVCVGATDRAFVNRTGARMNDGMAVDLPESAIVPRNRGRLFRGPLS